MSAGSTNVHMERNVGEKGRFVTIICICGGCGCGDSTFTCESSPRAWPGSTSHGRPAVAGPWRPESTDCMERPLDVAFCFPLALSSQEAEEDISLSIPILGPSRL